MAVITIPYSVWLSKYISLEQAFNSSEDSLRKFLVVTSSDMGSSMAKLCDGAVHIDIEDFLTPAQRKEASLRADLALLDRNHQAARTALLAEISKLYSGDL